MVFQNPTSHTMFTPVSGSRRSAPPADKVSTKPLGQRLGWKKTTTAHDGSPTNEVDPAAVIGAFKLECGLVPLEAAQRRRGRNISAPVELRVGECGWRACGAYTGTAGCTLLSLDVARADKAIAHRMFL